MRVLVISDIHANLFALEAVLADAGQVDAVWCLGDLVGYGPDPNGCISRIRALPGLVCLLGNHDAAALGQIDIENFNTDARASMLWTQNQVGAEQRAFLASLPELVVVDQVTLAHGSPRNPVWEYILESRTATVNFTQFTGNYCFVGHTHLPVLYIQPEAGIRAVPMLPHQNGCQPIPIRAILNPGSVGQPRDRDARAAYAIFDTETSCWQSCRVAYDVAAVQQAILQAGLPARHAQRLAEGW